VLTRLGTDSGSVNAEIQAIQESLDREHHSLAEPLFQPRYRQPIMLAVAIAMFNQALGSFTHWIMAAAISWTFPMFAEASGGHTFAFYAAMMVLQLVWVIFWMPETKGVPLEEIQKQLHIE
jgi:hypothetical protein